MSFSYLKYLQTIPYPWDKDSKTASVILHDLSLVSSKPLALTTPALAS